MNRRIILVDFYWTRDKDPRVPLGHASLLTTLRAREGLDVHPILSAHERIEGGAIKVGGQRMDLHFPIPRFVMSIAS